MRIERHGEREFALIGEYHELAETLGQVLAHAAEDRNPTRRALREYEIEELQREMERLDDIT